MIVVGVSGKKAAGKDLLGGYLKYRGFSKESFANYLKERVRADFNLTKEQTDGPDKEKPTKFGMTPREILQQYGSFMRTVYQNFWVDKTVERIRGMHSEARVVVTDVRYPNEAEAIKAIGGYVVRLNRSTKNRELIYPGCGNDTHESEVALDDYKGFDLVLGENENDNPQDVEKFADRLVDFIAKDQANRKSGSR